MLDDIVRVDRVKQVISHVFLVNDILLVDDKHHLLDVTNQHAVHVYVAHVYHVYSFSLFILPRSPTLLPKSPTLLPRSPTLLHIGEIKSCSSFMTRLNCVFLKHA